MIQFKKMIIIIKYLTINFCQVPPACLPMAGGEEQWNIGEKIEAGEDGRHILTYNIPNFTLSTEWVFPVGPYFTVCPFPLVLTGIPH